MAFSLSSPVTGSAQTGLTSPTYTVASDVAPDATGKQYACTALGGTQASVRTHSVSDPFTITMFRPKQFKAVGQVNPSTGLLYNTGKNVWKVIARKGVLPLAGQSPNVMITDVSISVPAGADSADAPNIRAGLSMLFGALNQASAGIGDALVTGIL